MSDSNIENLVGGDCQAECVSLSNLDQSRSDGHSASDTASGFEVTDDHSLSRGNPGMPGAHYHTDDTRDCRCAGVNVERRLGGEVLGCHPVGEEEPGST